VKHIAPLPPSLSRFSRDFAHLGRHENELYDRHKKVPVFEMSFHWKTNSPKSATRVCVTYLVAICKEVMMRLTWYAKKGVKTRLHSSLDSGSQFKTNT
jgi:hypothetical protein